MSGGPAANWRFPEAYGGLLVSDRRAFAWEWLRRSPLYRTLWKNRARVSDERLESLGLHGWIDPALSASEARPIWSVVRDPRVLRGRPARVDSPADDLFDVRDVAPFVSVEIDAEKTEHWLLSDGHWAIRLDLHDGTLLGGPILVEHRISGLQSAKPKLEALRQFVVLAESGRLPRSMMPRERKAAQWILELRVGDAILSGATQQEMARILFGAVIASRRWRIENASHRLRVQRLVRIARRRLADPLSGPWFG
ncbi:hypothetical protein BV98_002774 [Sphingobium herbicidovorans NBRC 16415]|uniref:DUF2285 domain-containing protein n=1 Tax=Sphingobium herbicidovorans (strain ATCC 700291 / DSM 11019 / CCUG 56400 / KCTC 2939 / LMG 18315 / NBRC 16415 / MH) TaxID=1219045 RepID=A0A086P7S7_SPHHM|nr:MULTISPECIES: DUF2285 domain-containing protein [Sphingomonadaceae]KFG89445.1 hypothetical protein BV98_002774 [Sphingobium herbicidovorans NBRC 16415]